MKKLILFLLFLFLSTQAHAAITLVQSATTYTGGSPQSKAFTSPVTVGNLIVVAYQSAYPSTDPTITDTTGNTFIKVIESYSSGDVVTDYIYYAVNKTTASDTVSATEGTGASDSGFDISEWSGVSVSSIVSSAATWNVGSTLNAGTAAITGTALVIVLCGDENSSPGYSAGSGFTQLYYQSSHVSFSEYQIVSSSGSSSGVVNMSSPAAGAIVMAVFGNARYYTVWPYLN